MSYQTVYTLEWKGNTPTLEQVAQVLALTSFRSEKRGPSTIYDTPHRMEATILSWVRILTGEDETTWYQHQADMAHVSRLWPQVDFIMHLNGEDSLDFTIEYYQRGLVQPAEGRIEYPEFDPATLEQPKRHPTDVMRPETFCHQGWLALAQTGGYWAVPMAGTTQPESTGTGPTPETQGVLLDVSCRAEAIRMISSWQDTSGDGPKPQGAVRKTPRGPAAEAKQAVLDAVREA